MKMEKLDEFDERVDALWATAKLQFLNIGERTERYLNWRFTNCSLHQYRLVGLIEKSGCLMAYLAYTENDGFVNVVDLLAANDEALIALLGEFIVGMRANRQRSISFMYLGSSMITSVLRRFGFVRRQGQARVLVYLTEKLDATAKKSLMSTDAWHLTLADADF